MPWMNPPLGGSGSDDRDAFFVKKVIRRPVKPDARKCSRKSHRELLKKRSGKRPNAKGGRPPTNVYVFEARIVRQSDHYLIYVFKWPRPNNLNILLDGVRTNLLNGEIIWISRDQAPRTRDDAVAWFFKWADCLVDYFETGALFNFPRDPDL